MGGVKSSAPHDLQRSGSHSRRAIKQGHTGNSNNSNFRFFFHSKTYIYYCNDSCNCNQRSALCNHLNKRRIFHRNFLFAHIGNYLACTLLLDGCTVRNYSHYEMKYLFVPFDFSFLGFINKFLIQNQGRKIPRTLSSASL